jgi:hypothetical protein
VNQVAVVERVDVSDCLDMLLWYRCEKSGYAGKCFGNGPAGGGFGYMLNRTGILLVRSITEVDQYLCNGAPLRIRSRILVQRPS